MKSASTIQIQPGFEALLAELGIRDGADVFSTSHARVWRSIRERENATIDPPDGAPRLHLKRDKLPLGPKGASSEARGILALKEQGLPTAELVAFGTLPDGRSFSITQDLSGYQPADQLIRSGVSFDQLCQPLADVAGRLHRARLFHQDLYLCHFYVRNVESGFDVRLIDLARVLVRPICFARWQVKDLAQFSYSTRDLAISPGHLNHFFDLYGQAFGGTVTPRFRRLIDFKTTRIAAHDLELHRRQPNRDVTLRD